MLGTICDFDLTHDLDYGCFKVKFRNSCISGIVGPIDVKWKWSELISYWADCMTLPFDHTHDLDPEVEISRSKSEIALSQEWDGRLTWNEKDVSHPFMTMIFTSVTMVEWADVPVVTGVTSDVDVPSTYLVLTWYLMWIPSVGNHGAAGGISEQRHSRPVTAIKSLRFALFYKIFIMRS